MTDPRPDDPKTLEPWMLEQLRADGIADDPESRQELARLVALLRSLPDPEASPDLAVRVLAYVAEHDTRPRVVRLLQSRPATSFLVAAGLAALFAVTFTPETIPSVLRPASGSPEAPAMQPATPATTQPRRRAPVVRPQWVNQAFQIPGAMPTPAQAPRMLEYYAPSEERFSMRLDHQLNQLMINPTAFAQRVERMAQRDQFIARLANRAAERGDAPEIALVIRNSPHPVAGVLVERLLRATLVADARTR